MRIFYFDDSGNKVSRSHDRYFCLAGFSVSEQDLPKLEVLRNQMWSKHQGLGLPGDEMKFAHVGMKFDKPTKPNPLVRIGMDYDERREFVLEALGLLSSIPSLEIVGGVVDKHLAYGRPHFEHALNVLVERCEMSLQEKSSIGLMFCDEENKAQTPMRALLASGRSEYVNFTRIKETIAFVPSQMSAGVQFADLVVGSIARAANRGDWRYLSTIIHKVRSDSRGNWQSHGIKVFPRGAFPGA